MHDGHDRIAKGALLEHIAVRLRVERNRDIALVSRERSQGLATSGYVQFVSDPRMFARKIGHGPIQQAPDRAPNAKDLHSSAAQFLQAIEIGVVTSKIAQR